MFWMDWLCSLFRRNCGLHPGGTENAVLYAAAVRRRARGSNNCVCAVSIAVGQGVGFSSVHEVAVVLFGQRGSLT